MTSYEINKVIAEHLGWRGGSCGWWQRPDCMDSLEIPNFCADLNAMHGAENVLEPKQKWEFSLRLIVMQENSTLTQSEDWTKLIDYKFKAPGFFAAIFATSAQRAEAFLKTVGKWRE